MQIVTVEGQRRAQLNRSEQVVSDLHDRWVAQGVEAKRAARRIRSCLAEQAPATQLSAEFWGWLGC